MSSFRDITSTPESPVRLTSDQELLGILQRIGNYKQNEGGTPHIQTKKDQKNGTFGNTVEGQKIRNANVKLGSTIIQKIDFSPNKKLDPVSLKNVSDDESDDSEEIIPLHLLLSDRKAVTPPKSDPLFSKLRRDSLSSKSITKNTGSTVIVSKVGHTSSKKRATNTNFISNVSSNNIEKQLSTNNSVTRGIENLNLVTKDLPFNARKMLGLCEKENTPAPAKSVHSEIPKKPLVAKGSVSVAVKGCGEFGVVSQKVFYVNSRCYHALSILGQGGSGKVFQVIESESSKIVALKEVYLDKIDKTSCMNEINLLNKLKKSHRVIKLFDYEVKDKTILMILEKGDSDFATILKEAKSGCPLSPIQIKYYWSELLLAVGDVHKAGIIHLDLKPANFVQVKGKLKIIDFGIAGALPEDKTCLVKENIIGTLNYMSPEQITGTQNNNTQFQLRTKSDVWSLGIILYHLLHGVTPFHHITNVACKLQAISNPNYQISYSEIKDASLVNVLRLCLQHDPKKRPTIEELLSHPYLTGR